MAFFLEIAELKNRRFDVMAILEMGSRPADRGRLLGRSLGIGYVISSYSGLLKHLPDFNAPPNSGVYWPQYFLKVVEHLGIPGVPPQLELPPSTGSKVDSIMSKLVSESASQGHWVGLHPGVAQYASLTKKWPKKHFIELGVELVRELNARIVVTGSLEEKEECEAVVQEIRRGSSSSGVFNLAGELSVPEYADFIKRLKVLVVADTGALHLAEAAGVTVVALFGATDPQLISSGRKGCVVLTEDLPCRPCHRSRDRGPFWPKCLYSEPLCLTKITHHRVFQEIRQCLTR